MPRISRPRHGSLQFYPRKRIYRFLPSVNWSVVKGEESLLGFIAYKAGMASALVKDNTENVLTKGKQLTIPVTILEIPPMKIFSVRFYKNSIPLKDIIVAKDKELKRKLKLPNSIKEFDKEIPQDYSDIRVIAYSQPSKTSLKKTPDLIELGIDSKNKLELVKSLLNKDITFEEFKKYKLIDLRGLTKGKGISGPVKRFGITLRHHKSEKGVRKVGSIGPWHPARVMFRNPSAGQLGTFSRILYNLNVLASGTISEKDINPSSGFHRYGKIKTSYLIIKGSVQGPPKRQILITPSFRPSRHQAKKQYQFGGLIK